MITKNNCINDRPHKWSGSDPHVCLECGFCKDEMRKAWRLPFEGLDLLLTAGIFISPGDTYVARRNGDWCILTCKVMDDRGFVLPKEEAYPFDVRECHKVLGILDA